MHCSGCGEKLNLESITRESISSAVRRRRLLRGAAVACGAALAVCALLALWPAPAGREEGTEQEYEAARAKLSRLQQGLAVDPVMFTEMEVDMLVNRLLRERNRMPDAKPGVVEADSIQVEIGRNKLNVQINYLVRFAPLALDPFSIGPFRLTYTVRGRIADTGDGLRYIVRGGSAGHLPIPCRGGGIGMAKVEWIFGPFKNARVFLAGLKITDARKGQIWVLPR